MDEIVARAMRKWPDVPNVYGWLRLDRRGNWLVKSRATQAGAPVFERIGNAAVIAFIGRNYLADDAGRWYFQNGPQRVFVTLDYTPFVYRLDGGLVAHTGAPAGELDDAFLDDRGALLLDAALGPGVLTDRDLPLAAESLVDAAGVPLGERAAEAIAAGAAWLALGATPIRVHSITFGEVAARFGFDPDPRPPPGAPDC